MNSEPRDAYDAFYATFDSPLMERVRREAYGEDIGQHSWVTADEMRADVVRLALGQGTRLLDIGCGPCGPLVFALRATGCRGTGVDVSAAALVSGLARARDAGVDNRITLLESDLDRPLPFADAAFDAVISFDVVLHLRDRRALFAEVARVLAPGGAFLFTDAGVVTGPISNEEVARRSANGHSQFVPRPWNASALAAAGMRLVEEEDRTPSVIANGSGRLRARAALQTALERSEGTDAFARQTRYLETVVDLSARRALSRIMYLAALAMP